MGEVEKVASLLGILTPLIPGKRKRKILLGFRPGRCQHFFFFSTIADSGSWLGKSFFSARRKGFDLGFHLYLCRGMKVVLLDC